jgi:hypothetical protein
MQLRSVACVSTSRRRLAMLCARAISVLKMALTAGSLRASATSDRSRNIRASSGNSDDAGAAFTDVIFRLASSRCAIRMAIPCWATSKARGSCFSFHSRRTAKLMSQLSTSLADATR